MDKQRMLDEIVNALGMEHKHAIWFAQLIEEGVSEDSLWTAMIHLLDLYSIL